MKLLALTAATAASLAVAVPHASVNTPLNEYNYSVDARERTMVFARSEADFKHARIFTARRVGRHWSEPTAIAFSDARYSDSDPWLTPDGKTLYFISDRPAPGREEGRKDYDIWRADLLAGGWSAPEHLGAGVNGQGQELGPEMHGGALYFASARRTGRGGLDIYRAKLVGASYGPAELLEGPFNSAASESDFTLSRDGKAAMFWRSTGDGGVIHFAHRTGAAWSAPAPLGSGINIGPFNFTPSFAAGGQVIRYASTRERAGQTAGNADVYEAPLPRY